MDKTRIASLIYPGLDRVATGAEPPWQQAEQIRVLLRRHLPAITASLFADAQPAAAPRQRIDRKDADQASIDWYSDLPGHPVAFETLSDTEQKRVVALVEDRLRSIRQLADELADELAEGLANELADQVPDVPTPSRDGSALLRQAARYPHPRCIYLVGDEPVLTYWGLDAPRQAHRRPAGPLTKPSEPSPRPRRLRAQLVSALSLLVLGGLAFGVWHWWQTQLRAELQGDLEAGLAAHCEPTALLEALHARLTRIDPSGDRFPILLLDTERELNRCADAADIDARLGAAWEDCAELPALADALYYQDLSVPPFVALKSRLDTRMADCRLADELRQSLTSAVGDCDAITALDNEHAALAREDYPVGGPAMEIAAEAAACRIAAELRPRLLETDGACRAVRALDRDLGQRIAADPALDLSSAPIAALRADLDKALDDCALADHLTARLAESQRDCVALFALRATLSRLDGDSPPFDQIRRPLDESLAQCAALNVLETRFTEAQGDCDQVQAFSGELERWRDNLRFADIRARIAAEQGICKQADQLMDRIAKLGMDCAGLRALAESVAERAGSQFDRARAALKTKLGRCDTLARYIGRLKDAGSHCGRLKGLQRDLQRQTGAFLKPVRDRLAEALNPCRPKPKPAVVAKPPRGSGAYALSGECSGNLVISPAGGYNGDRVRHIVSIAPPGNARIAKVVSDNRGCRNCRLTKRNASTWSVGLFYGCSGRGSVPIAYSAYDRSGKLVCSGRGVARCLGRRR